MIEYLALLQRGLPGILEAPRGTFVACLAVEHISSSWTVVNGQVFIPKAGKRLGNNLKSFRPISLT